MKHKNTTIWRMALWLLLIAPSLGHAALIFHAGFETADAAEWTTFAGTGSVNSTAKHTGNYGYQVNAPATNGYVTYSDTGVRRTTFYLNIQTGPSVEKRIFGALGAANWCLYLDSLRRIALYYGATPTHKATGITALSVGQWYRISISCDGANACKVFINGTQELSQTQTGITGIDVALGMFASSNANLYFDDVAADKTASTDDLGDIRVGPARPIGEGTDQNTGSGVDWQDPGGQPATYDHIDSDPPNTTDYDWAEADGALMSYTVALDECGSGNLAGIGGSDTIEAVNFMWYYKTGGGGGVDEYYKVTYDQGARIQTSIDDPTVATWLQSYEVDCPSDGDPWTQTNFNTVEMGMATDDANKDLWFYEAYAMVAFKVAGGNNYSETFNNSIGLTDARALTRIVVRTMADPLGLTDARTPVREVNRSFDESMGVSDDRSKGRGISSADDLGLTDEMTRSHGFGRAIADSLGLSDTETEAFAKVLADALDLSDAWTKEQIKVLADSLGLSDEMVRVAIAVRTIADSLGLSDEETAAFGFGRIMSDVMGLTDATATAQFKVLADSLGVTDEMLRTAIVLRMLEDSLGLTDVVILDAVYVVADSLGLTDIMEGVKSKEYGVPDDIGLTDAMTRVAIALRAIDENLGLTDEAARTLILVRVIADSLGLTDAMTTAQGKAVAEALGLTDEISRTAVVVRSWDDSLGLTDTQSKTQAKSVAESLGLTDEMGRVAVVLRTVADDLDITDSMDYDLSGGIIRTVNDSLGLSDAIVPVRTVVRTVDESLGLSDTQTKVSEVLRTIADSLGLTDTRVISIGVFETVNDSLGLTDIMSYDLLPSIGGGGNIFRSVVE